MSDWTETRAAFSRLKASWLDLQEARREGRDLDRLIRARTMVIKAIRIHPDALEPYLTKTAEMTLNELFARGLIDLETLTRQRSD